MLPRVLPLDACSTGMPSFCGLIACTPWAWCLFGWEQALQTAQGGTHTRANQGNKPVTPICCLHRAAPCPQALQADARSNKLSSEEALQELSASVAALGSQLQASLQHRVFGSAGFTMPALPTDASRSPAAKGECCAGHVRCQMAITLWHAIVATPQ